MRSLAKAFFIDLPDGLVDDVLKDPKHAAELGQRWALKQSQDLLARGCKTLHYYVLNDVAAVKDTVLKLGL